MFENASSTDQRRGDASPSAATDMLDPEESKWDARVWSRQETRMCKALSYVLRHGAVVKGLRTRADGYVNVDDILKLSEFRSLGLLTLIYIVKSNKKRRFSLAVELDGELMDVNPEQFFLESTSEADPSKLYIRALQGHSINIIDKTCLYVQVINPAQIPVCVHGTYWAVWDSIMAGGLQRMSRLHIHFAGGLPGDPNILSGIRLSAEVAIYINVPLAMSDGIEFWTSHNGVILSEGIDGIIPKKYFLKACILPDCIEIPLRPRVLPD